MLSVFIVIRKLLKNKWLTLSLLLGLVICVALVMLIPLYSDGILQRLLIQDLEKNQLEKNSPSGLVSFNFIANERSIAVLKAELAKASQTFYKNLEIQQYYQTIFESAQKIQFILENNFASMINLPLLSQNLIFSSEKRILEPVNKNTQRLFKEYADLKSLRGLEDNLELIAGRLPKEQTEEALEVLISANAQRNYGIVLEEVYTLKNRLNPDHFPLLLRPVGVFTINSTKNPYWGIAVNDELVSDCFFIAEEIMLKKLLPKEPSLLASFKVSFVFDYYKITVNLINTILTAHETIISKLNLANKNRDWDIFCNENYMPVLTSYQTRSFYLNIFMWSLNTNVLILLFLYLFLSASLIVENEKNEIALLVSRGATRFQLLIIYSIQGLLLGAMALILGALLASFFLKLLGAASGFLQFVERKALPLIFSEKVIYFPLVAILGSIIITLIPVAKASSLSIIAHKHNLAQEKPKPFWEKYFLDLVLLLFALASYLFYALRLNPNFSQISASEKISFDPLLFIMPALFITGLSFLFLRIYPFLIKFIFTLGRRFWNAGSYLTLLRLSRSFHDYYFLSLFLIFTLAIGVFSASAARTINQNVEDRVYYHNGADIVLLEHWQLTSKSSPNPASGISAPLTNDSTANPLIESISRKYTEPLFDKYKLLPGVENAAKVFKRKVNLEFAEKVFSDVQLIAFIPEEFGRTIKFRRDLLPTHINNYLNMLTKYPQGCFISNSLSKNYKIKTGDVIWLRWENHNWVRFYVLGVVNYWPSWDPLAKVAGKNPPALIIANLHYVQINFPLEPYEVWLALKKGASIEELYRAIAEQKISLAYLNNSAQEIIKARRDPFQLALNGILTIGFLICLIISALGFLLYWIIAINRRLLQFGVFKALGLSTTKLLGMLILENMIISGFAIASGLASGLMASFYFIPFFQFSFDSHSQVPPFRIIWEIEDHLKIILIIGLVIFGCLVLLGYIIRRLRVGQTLKLGED